LEASGRPEALASRQRRFVEKRSTRQRYRSNRRHQRSPVKKLGRLRTLLKYGMTVSQLADLYSVPVETIERIRKV